MITEICLPFSSIQWNWMPTERTLNNAWNPDFSENSVSIRWTFRNVSIDWKENFHPVNFISFEGNKRIHENIPSSLLNIGTIFTLNIKVQRYTHPRWSWRVYLSTVCSSNNLTSPGSKFWTFTLFCEIQIKLSIPRFWQYFSHCLLIFSWFVFSKNLLPALFG